MDHHFQNQSDNTPATKTGGYGDSTAPITTDEYGNPLHVQTGGPQDYDWPKGGVYLHQQQPQPLKQHNTLGGLIHRSGSSSSSSSSSEDDGQGGRRKKKKGMKEKIKEKLPGKQKEDHQSSTTATTNPAGHYATADHGHHEKKGLLGKIKDKLPGHHPH